MKSKKFRIPRKRIAAFCQRWSITEFSLFGSALRDDFRPKSDVDVLVSIDPKADNIGLFEFDWSIYRKRWINLYCHGEQTDKLLGLEA